MFQEPAGRVLDKWNLCSREEEQVILQQFLRFGETRSIAQDIILKDVYEQQERHLLPHPRSESDIKKFLELSAAAATGDKQYLASLKSPPPQAPPPPPLEVRYPIRGFPAAAFAQMSKLNNQLNLAHVMKTPTKNEAACVPGSNGTSPIAGSPLRRLQTMRPFDCNRNINDMLSPNHSEKSAPSQPSPSEAPTSCHSRGNSPGAAVGGDNSPTKTSEQAAKASPHVARDPSGALDFSNKETSISASTAAGACRAAPQLLADAGLRRHAGVT